MKDAPKWRKLLAGADLVCVVAAFVTITAAMWMVQPESEAYMLLRFVNWALMGVHFVLHGFLSWKEQRWLAIFDWGVVAFVLVLIALAFFAR